MGHFAQEFKLRCILVSMANVYFYSLLDKPRGKYVCRPEYCSRMTWLSFLYVQNQSCLFNQIYDLELVSSCITVPDLDLTNHSGPVVMVAFSNQRNEEMCMSSSKGVS